MSHVSRVAAIQEPFRLEIHDSLGSTNDTAMERGRSGERGGLWVVAREQSAGRGRHGRAWQSPRGNLYASLLLVDPAPPGAAAQLSFVAGVALATTISDLLRHDRRVALKWPNDLLFGRAKLAGVLLEGAQTPAGRFACVLGFGVNCSHHPSGLAYPAIDLACVGQPIDPVQVLERLSGKVAEWIDIWDRGRGFGRVRETWTAFAAGLGERIQVRAAQGAIEGFFRGLDEEGRLLLETESGLTRVEAGDVFLSSEAGCGIEQDARA